MTTKDYLEFYYYCILRDYLIVAWFWFLVWSIGYAVFG